MRLLIGITMPVHHAGQHGAPFLEQSIDLRHDMGFAVFEQVARGDGGATMGLSDPHNGYFIGTINRWGNPLRVPVDAMVVECDERDLVTN